MKSPPRWSKTQLGLEAKKAQTLFREERLREPLKRWPETFDKYEEHFKRLLDEYGLASSSGLDAKYLVKILEDNLEEALRYLTGPPISADDLKVLAKTSLSPKQLKRDPRAAKRVLDTIRHAIDPRRFPWLVEERSPRPNERAAAIIASASLLAAQRVATDRRSEGKSAQEKAVKAYLTSIGFKEVVTRSITNLSYAPERGQYCSESLVGSRKADIPVRLYDGRLMPIECKVSNSSTNSVKRINNDAAVKAKIWTKEFGTSQIVPVAVLSGVFKVKNLEQAQDNDLTLFWAHKLQDMRAFINQTKKP